MYDMQKQSRERLADVITVRVSPSMRTALERAAIEEREPIGSIVRLAIRAALEQAGAVAT